MITIYKKTAEELHKHSLFSISNSTVFNSYKLGVCHLILTLSAFKMFTLYMDKVLICLPK